MKVKRMAWIFLGLAFALTLSLSARPWDDDDHHGDRDQCRDDAHHQHNLNTPLNLIGVMPIPGNPLVSADLIWADPYTERLYMADRSNYAVDIFDAVNDVYITRVPGFAGPNAANPPNGQGPNGLLVTPDKRLFVGDGNSMLRVVDVDPTHTSPLTYLTIIKSIDTSDAECNNGTVNKCNRADEMGYDSLDHIIEINNDQPLTPSGTAAAPYASFYSTEDYSFLGRIYFTGAGGLEQPVWDGELRRILVNVPGSTTQPPMVVIINPHHLNEGYKVLTTFNCSALTGTTSTAANGLALGPFQHLLASACGAPVVLSALDGHIINTITQVAGGDEVWYNPGDGRFLDVSTDKTVTVPSGTTAPNALGVIDAETGTWLQNVVDPGGAQAAALPVNNHIFTEVRVTATTTASNDTSLCAQFGYKGTGCVAVFTHP